MQKKILIADDSPEVLKLLKTRLRKEGYQVLSAENGRDALAMATLHLPDVIVLDIMMPHMDGTEVSRRLRQDPATRSIPLIYLTALKGTDDRTFDIPDGPEMIMGKPFDAIELIKKINELAAG